MGPKCLGPKLGPQQVENNKFHNAVHAPCADCVPSIAQHARRMRVCLWCASPSVQFVGCIPDSAGCSVCIVQDPLPTSSLPLLSPGSLYSETEGHQAGGTRKVS